jgi:hypothetical protein
VDKWLQPYLQLALKKLTTAEIRVLKDELLLLVANALYYNAAATVGLLQQFGAVQQLFGLLFTCIFARRCETSSHFRMGSKSSTCLTA